MRSMYYPIDAGLISWISTGNHDKLKHLAAQVEYSLFCPLSDLDEALFYFQSFALFQFSSFLILICICNPSFIYVLFLLLPPRLLSLLFRHGGVCRRGGSMDPPCYIVQLVVHARAPSLWSTSSEERVSGRIRRVKMF